MIIETVLLVIICFYLILITKSKNVFSDWKNSKLIAFTVFYYNLFKMFILNDNEIFQLYEDLTRKLPSPSALKIFIMPHTFVDKPEDIQIVLNSTLERPHVYRFAHNETGLVTAEESVWKVHRKLLNSSFNSKVLLSFFPIFNDKINILMNKIGENKDTFDIGPYFSRFSLDSICGTSFGWNSKIQEGKHKPYLEAANAYPDILFNRAANFLLYWDFIYKRTNQYAKEKFFYDNIYKMTSAVVADKRQEYNEEMLEMSTNDSEDDDVVYNKPQVLIKQLFKLLDSGKITEKSLFEHCDTIIGAGTETSASVLANAILLLAMHPYIQERVYQELKVTFPEQESFVTYDEIGKLSYLEMVIKETLRIIQTIPIFLKKATSDIHLPNGHIIKNGETINILLTNLHENPNIWENPKKFNPDNFLPDKIAARHPYSFIPFGQGPRICIGQRYSMLVMKTTLAKVIRKYKFTTEEKMENIRKYHAVTTKLITKHYVKLHKRDYV